MGHTPAKLWRRAWRGTVGRLTARQVNLLLAVALVGAVTTGIVSWAVGTGWSRWWTALHATCGIAVLLLAPGKVRGSARTGMRRARPSRWVSVLFGLMAATTIALGLAHATGLWYGVGSWSALWTHELLGFSLIPLLIWHLWSRPVRPRPTDLDRRAFIGGAATAGAAALAVISVEGASRVARLAGADRRFTGSHEVGSFEPDLMPSVSWIDDRAPSTPADEWELRIAGRPMPVDTIAALARPLRAGLDCTGGWWSEQRWDVVPIADLIPTRSASFEVTSSTGYSRIFPMRDASDVYVCVGYDGRPLRRGHGAPVRIVAPARRGPWWVKWVVSIEPTERPWWLQLPFPLT